MYSILLVRLCLLVPCALSQCTLESCDDVGLDKSRLGIVEQKVDMILAANNVQPKRPFDCSETESRASGVFSVHVDGIRDPVSVYCDHDTEGGQWTVFQKRQNGEEDFNRPWNDYALGFGNRTGEYWLGNEILNAMTATRKYILRVDLWDWEGEHRYATYDSFRVASEELRYRLTLGKYSGDAGDALTAVHNGMPFSTFDMDNNKIAAYNNGGFWYADRDQANPNAQYFYNSNGGDAGITWGSSAWHDESYSLKKVEMKMRLVK